MSSRQLCSNGDSNGLSLPSTTRKSKVWQMYNMYYSTIMGNGIMHQKLDTFVHKDVKNKTIYLFSLSSHCDLEVTSIFTQFLQCHLCSPSMLPSEIKTRLIPNIPQMLCKYSLTQSTYYPYIYPNIIHINKVRLVVSIISCLCNRLQYQINIINGTQRLYVC